MAERETETFTKTGYGTAIGPGTRVLITGGSGFIGGHLTQRCLELEADVTVLGVSGSSSCPEPSSLKNKKLVVDLRDPHAVHRTLRGQAFDHVFHLAGYIDHRGYFDGGPEVIAQHFEAVVNLIRAIDRMRLKTFVQVGSSDEYGQAPAPQREDSRENPISCYALGKTAATHLIQMLHRTERFPGVVLRLFLVYGPRQGLNRLIPQVIRECLDDQAFPISEGKQLRDFTYALDIVDGLLKTAMCPQALGEVINLSSGDPVSVRSVIELIVQLIGKGRPQFGARPSRPGENMALYADISKATQLLAWAPRTSLKEGLQQTIKYYRNGLSLR